MINDLTVLTAMEFCRDARAYTTPRILTFRKENADASVLNPVGTFKLQYHPERYYKYQISQWKGNQYVFIGNFKAPIDIYDELWDELIKTEGEDDATAHRETALVVVDSPKNYTEAEEEEKD